MTRVAAIDCGTNSIRLLVADAESGPEGSRLTDVVRTMEVVRLGQDVDRTGRLHPDAIDRTLAATGRYADLCARHGVERIRFVATSASRDVENRQAFVDGVRAVIGVPPEVISGEEEAELSFQGALSAVRGVHRRPYLVVDIGGGSTEFALGGDHVVASRSVNIGCVRLTERHVTGDPPTTDEVEAAGADISSALDAVDQVVSFGRTGTLVGLAGTVTTVTARALRLPCYDAERIDGAVLRPGALLQASRDLLGMTRAERAAQPYMHPGRVDVIGAGALIWSGIISRVRAEVAQAGSELRDVVTSEHDILDGIAFALGRDR